MRDLITAFLACLQEKYIVHPLHKLATFVSPQYEYLSFAGTAERKQVYTDMRQRIDTAAMSPVFATQSANAPHYASPIENKKANKKVKVDVDLLCEFKAVAPPEVSPEITDSRHENEKYLSLPVIEVDALKFWKEIDASHSLPVISFLARQLLAIPATSTTSERVFSACSVTLSEHRARRNTDTLEQLMFLKYNIQP
jgi:hypothetical protein